MFTPVAGAIPLRKRPGLAAPSGPYGGTEGLGLLQLLREQKKTYIRAPGNPHVHLQGPVESAPKVKAAK